MKKALLIVVAILAVTFLVGNADLIQDFINTLGTGAIVPLVIAVVLMIFRHLTQAASYDAAFEAAGFKTGFWHNVILIFSLVFINTFCLFSGATGLAFIIDDAHRKGADLGTATSGGLLSQIGFFAAVFVISIIGTIAMILTDSLNSVILIGFAALAAVLFGQTAFFIIGYYKPGVLRALLTFVEKIANKVLGIFKRGMRENWGVSTADSFIDSAVILAHNPMGIAITIAWASLSAILNMACLVAIGFAFGYDQIAPLVAAFSVAVVSIMLSPTPQGIGVTEAAIAVVLTASGSSLTTAAAIALVYRGIMLWIPFCIGAVMLSQSGFFKGKKNPTEDQKKKDAGWVLGTLVCILGIVNIVLSISAPTLAPYGMLTQFIDLRGALEGYTAGIGGLLLLICGVGLIMRTREMWVISLVILCLLGGLELYFGTYHVAIPIIALIALLVWKRDAFTKQTTWSNWKRERGEKLADGSEKTFDRTQTATVKTGAAQSKSAHSDDTAQRTISDQEIHDNI